MKAEGTDDRRLRAPRLNTPEGIPVQPRYDNSLRARRGRECGGYWASVEILHKVTKEIEVNLLTSAVEMTTKESNEGGRHNAAYSQNA